MYAAAEPLQPSVVTLEVLNSKYSEAYLTLGVSDEERLDKMILGNLWQKYSWPSPSSFHFDQCSDEKAFHACLQPYDGHLLSTACKTAQQNPCVRVLDITCTDNQTLTGLLHELQDLQVLRLNGESHFGGGQWIGELKRFPNFHTLILQHCGRFSREEFQQLVRLSRLNHLELHYTSLEDYEGSLHDILTYAKGLKSLTIYNYDLSKIQVNRIFEFLPSLQKLSLQGCGGFDHIAFHHTGLKYLDLRNTYVRSIDLKDCTNLVNLSVAVNQDLKELDLTNCSSLVYFDTWSCPNIETCYSEGVSPEISSLLHHIIKPKSVPLETRQLLVISEDIPPESTVGKLIRCTRCGTNYVETKGGVNLDSYLLKNRAFIGNIKEGMIEITQNGVFKIKRLGDKLLLAKESEHC